MAPIEGDELGEKGATAGSASLEPTASTESTASTEIWGWWAYDFALNAFSAAALLVSFPLLLTTLADAQAYAELGQSAPPQCSTLGPNLATALPASSPEPCLICVPGQGTQLRTPQGLQPYPQPRVTAGALSIDPVAYATSAAGVAVLVQVLAFITLGPLADYGRGRKDMLVVSVVLGSFMCMLCLTLVSPSLWWLAGVYLIIANACFGLALVCWNSYLPILVDAHPEVLEASKRGQTERLAVRENVSNRISLTGVALGSLGGTLAVCFASGVALTTQNPLLQLRLATAAAGVFWLGFSTIPFVWLKARPGPPFPPTGLSPTAGWKRVYELLSEARKYKNMFMFLFTYFVFADGHITAMQIMVLYAQRVICMSNLQLMLLVVSLTVWVGIGAVLSFWVQRCTGLGNKPMLVLSLGLIVPVPLLGLLGFYIPLLEISQAWQVYALSAVFGVVLGPVFSFTRTVFIDMIPVGTEGMFFSLFSITDKGSSWLGPLVVAAVVQATGDMRPSFIYVLAVILAPIFMLVFLVNHKQGMVEAGRAHEHSDLKTIAAE